MKYIAIGENHLYSKVYARGKKVVGRRVVVYVLPDLKSYKLKVANPFKIKINRVGLTVTKKIGGAVTRNRVKRIIREAFRLSDKESNFKTGNLIVIVAREASINSKMNDIKSELNYAFKKLNMSLAV